MRNAETAAFVAAWILSFAAPAAGGEAFAIVGARVFPGTSATERHDDWTVVVRDGVVSELGPRGSIDVPDGVRLVDGRGRTVLPGLIDLHVHLFGSAGRVDRPVDVDPTLNAAAAAAFGVTTLLDLNAPEDRLVERYPPGRARRPGAARVLFAGAALSAPSGHGTEGGFPGRTATTAAEARRQVRQLVARGVHVVKLIADGGGWADVPEVPALSDEAMRAAIEAAHAADRLVVVHAVEVERARAAVLAGADALAHLPLVGAMDDAFVALLAERGTAVIPTLAAYEAQFRLVDEPAILAEPDVRRFVPAAVLDGFVESEWRDAAAAAERPAWFRERYGEALARLSRLHAAGVVLLPGTDAGVPGVFFGDALHRELEAWVEAGIPAGEALCAATSRAARFLGIDEGAGTLAPGRAADLLLVDGDPTADVSTARRVVRVAAAGRWVEREALARRLAGAAAVPVERSLALADFEDGPPAGFQVRRSAHADEREARASRVRDGGEGNPTRFLRVEGDVRFRPPSGGFAGLHLPIPEGVDCAAYVGLRFRARAAERRTVRLLVATDAVVDGDHHGAKCVVGPEWHSYHVPFDSLRQVGHGRRVRFDPSRVIAVELLTEAGDDGPFRIDVDDLELYR